VPSGAQALGGVDHPGAHAEHGMEQGDLVIGVSSHRGCTPAEA